jgi:hypothetical protein
VRVQWYYAHLNQITKMRARFILANTEQLHAKINQMRDRINTLEDALQALQSNFSRDAHPLLHEDLLHIKNSKPEFPSHALARLESSPSLSDRKVSEPEEDGPLDSAENDNPAQTACDEVSDEGCSSLPPVSSPLLQHPISSHLGPDQNLELSQGLLLLSLSFPVPWSGDAQTQTRRQVRDLLPPRPEAEFLYEQVNRIVPCL